jgi:pimeloyl-ACP methyl ester carboxylesterase
MNIDEYGRGRPIIFVHGWRLSGEVEASDFEPIFVGRRGWRRIYPDLPGMGKTAPDPNTFSLDDFLRWVIQATEAKTAGEPFAVVGTSAGALLARGLVAAMPGRPRGLLLRVPLLDGAERRPIRPHERALHSDAERDAFYAGAEDSLRGVSSEFIEASAEKRESLWSAARDGADEAFLEPIRNDPARYRLTLPQLQDPFDGPTLIVAGRQDMRVGFEETIGLLAQYPRATLAVLDRAGHTLPVGNEPLFTALVEDWLDRVEEEW